VAKQYIDWTDFSTPEESIDLISNSIRKGIDYDGYGEKTVFKAIVLTPTIQITNTEARAFGAAFKQEITSTGRKFKFKARIVEENSPHSFIPNPCNLARNDSTKESTINPESLVAMHTDVIMMIDGHIAIPCAGDIVEIQLKKNDFSYDLNVARFIRTIARNAGEMSITNERGCQTIARNFDTMPVYEGPKLPALSAASNSNAFFNKLKNSPYFEGFSDEFLIGLAANAQAESGFVVNIGGDPLSLYEKYAKEGRVSQKTLQRVQGRALDGKCSFGYFQLNICPNDGGGSELLSNLGIDPATQKEEAMAAILNEDNQLKYVADTMRNIFGSRVSTETDPFAAADEICTKFERPANAAAKGKQRGELALKIAKKVS